MDEGCDRTDSGHVRGAEPAEAAILRAVRTSSGSQYPPYQEIHGVRAESSFNVDT